MVNHIDRDATSTCDSAGRDRDGIARPTARFYERPQDQAKPSRVELSRKHASVVGVADISESFYPVRQSSHALLSRVDHARTGYMQYQPQARGVHQWRQV